jgi:hypothetical protein
VLHRTGWMLVAMEHALLLAGENLMLGYSDGIQVLFLCCIGCFAGVTFVVLIQRILAPF